MTISALEAYEKAVTNRQKLVNMEMLEIEQKVLDNIKSGTLSRFVVYEDKLYDENLVKLEKLGYTVTERESTPIGFHTIISFDKKEL